MIRLCEAEWFDGIYKKIYDILSVEGMLPSPCEIKVLPPSPPPPEVRGVRALGMYNVRERVVWFWDWPPHPIIFAHELIHAVGGKEEDLEEIYGYNLSSFVVMLAENDIVPPVNPVRLFRDVTITDIVEALRSAYGYPFKDILEYFEVIGVVPVFADMSFDDGRFKLRFKENYSEKTISITAVSDIIAGAEYDKYAFKTLLELMGILSVKTRRGNQSPRSIGQEEDQSKRDRRKMITLDTS